MAEPTNTFAAGEEIQASKVNQNITEALNDYRDFTLGETITATPTAVYLKAADGKVYKTSATPVGENMNNFVGFTKEAGIADDVKKVQIGGKVSGLAGLTTGVDYYLSDAAGEIGTTAGANELVVGMAVSATQLLLFQATRKKYVDKKDFTAWTTPAFSSGTVYQAASDLIILAILNFSGSTGSAGKIEGYTDAASSPTNIRCVAYAGQDDYGSHKQTLVLPVKKNDYWKIVYTKTTGTVDGAATLAILSMAN